MSAGTTTAGSAPARTVAPARPRRRLADRALPLITVIGVLALFELAARTELLPSRHFPPMTETFATLGELLVDGGYWTAVGQTMEGWALGLGLAVVAGIPLGMLIGSSPLLYRALRVPIEFLRPIPSVALIPLAVLVWGTGLESKVFLAAFASFWPLLIQTVYGVQDVDPVATDTARSFGFSRGARLVRVTLPSALPYIATGLRISSAVALILAVTAELVIGLPGLGQAINLARSGGAVDEMYALIITTGAIGWILNVAAQQVERRALSWHVSQRRRAR